MAIFLSFVVGDAMIKYIFLVREIFLKLETIINENINDSNLLYVS